MMLQDTLGSREGAFAVREETHDELRAEPLDVEPAGEWPEDIEVMADTSLTIPGRGDRPGDCGDYLPLKFCPECGSEHMLQHRCKGRRCPACEGIWTGERAEAATVRLQAARLAEPDGFRRRAIHAVASPESLGTSLDAFRRGASRAHELAQEHGIRGGAVIPHAFRVKEEVKAEYRSGVEKGEIRGIGIWAWLKEEREQNWRTSVYYSPHFHIIGLCEDMEESTPERDDGWNLKNIRPLTPVDGAKDSDAHSDMYGAFYYLLSHLSFDPEASNHSVRWFGETAYCNFSASEALELQEELTLESAVEELREEASGNEESHTCEEGCGDTVLESIREARRQLENERWCNEIGSEQQARLLAAWRWVAGEERPPPGLKHPPSKADAGEALEALVRG